MYIQEKLKFQNQLREVRLCLQFLILGCSGGYKMLNIIKYVTFQLTVNLPNFEGVRPIDSYSEDVLSQPVTFCPLKIRRV
jgi:hypothetical protein